MQCVTYVMNLADKTEGGERVQGSVCSQLGPDPTAT